MTAHTPGPWIIARPVKGYGAMVTTPPDAKGLFEAVADVPEPNAEANARLIAAAPDLRAACDALVKAAGHGNQGWAMLSEAVGLARAALAKAEGAT